jgi:hypothetical protein
MAAKSAYQVIKAMYSYCLNHRALSNDAQNTMKDYFHRTDKMKSGTRKRKSKKTQI